MGLRLFRRIKIAPGISFKTPSDLWEVLARNMGGGMPPEVPKTLVNLCGPRVESLPAKKAVKRGK